MYGGQNTGDRLRAQTTTANGQADPLHHLDGGYLEQNIVGPISGEDANLRQIQLVTNDADAEAMGVGYGYGCFFGTALPFSATCSNNISGGDGIASWVEFFGDYQGTIGYHQYWNQPAHAGEHHRFLVQDIVSAGPTYTWNATVDGITVLRQQLATKQADHLGIGGEDAHLQPSSFHMYGYFNPMSAHSWNHSNMTSGAPDGFEYIMPDASPPQAKGSPGCAGYGVLNGPLTMTTSGLC